LYDRQPARRRPPMDLAGLANIAAAAAPAAESPLHATDHSVGDGSMGVTSPTEPGATPPTCADGSKVIDLEELEDPWADESLTMI